MIRRFLPGLARGTALLLILAAPAGCAWFREPPGVAGSPTAGNVTPLRPASPAVPPAGTPADTTGPSAGTGSAGIPSPADSTAAGAGSTVPGGREPGGTAPGGPQPTPPPPPPRRSSPGVSDPLAVPEAALSGGDLWKLDGRALSGRSGPEGQVIQIVEPIITHGRIVIRARDGEYAVGRGEARLAGGVTFREPTLEGSANRATYNRDTEVLIADGNVSVETDTLRVTSDHARYDRALDVITFHGNVRGARATRRLSAEEGQWSRNRKEVLLRGNVVVTQTDEKTTLRGERILYDIERDRAQVLESPRLVLAEGDQRPIEITGARLWVEPGGNATASGSVEVERGEITAFADSAAFFRDQHRAVLLGNPVVSERDGTLTGDTLTLFFDEDQALRRAEMHGNAHVRFAPRDTARAGEVSTVRGDTLVMFFEEEGANEVLVFGGAESTYQPSPKDRSQGTGTNVVRGDSITIYVDEGEVDRVKVAGKAKGVFTFVEGDSAGAAGLDTLAARPDTLAAPGDSLAARPDTLAAPGAAGPVTDKVVYAAREVQFNLDEKVVDLFGEVSLDYGALTLNAGKVRFYAERRYIDAEEKPVLVDRGGGEERKVIGRRMDYDLDTREGTIDRGRTKAEDGFIYADRLRQVGEDDFIAKNGNFTTCDNVEHDKAPHFHFMSSKMRLYLKDKVVAKPVTLYIRDIPILAIPFYVFSVRQGRQSGFLTPDFDFGLGGTSGRSWTNLGYYWAASQYWDLAVSTNYTDSNSRFVGRAAGQYAKLGLMKGTVSFARTLSSGVSEYDLVGAHDMTLGAWRVTARGEFRTSDFRRNEPLRPDFGARVDRILKSDASLSRSFKFGSGRLSFLREKELDVRPGDGEDETILTERLPEYSFSVNSRALGRAPNAAGRGGYLPGLASVRWSLSSSGSTVRTERERTTLVPVDSVQTDTLYAILSERTSRAVHNLNLTDTRRILGALNVSPSLRATETWVDREFSAADTVKGFRRAATWGASVSGSTVLYGTFGGIGPVEAIRHTFYPRVGFTYQPEFSNLTFTDTTATSNAACREACEDERTVAIRDEDRRHLLALAACAGDPGCEAQEDARHQSALSGIEAEYASCLRQCGVRRNRFPGVSASESRSVSLSMEHAFQAKVRAGEDVKRIDLFRWNASSSYDFVTADRGGEGWSNVSSNFDLPTIYGVGLSFNSAHDPYRRFRFQRFQLTGTYALSGKLPGSGDAEPTTAVEPSGGGDTESPWSSLGADQSLSRVGKTGPAALGGEDLTWSAGFSISYRGDRGLDGESLNRTASLNFRTSLKLTKNWSVDYSIHSWDLIEGRIGGDVMSLHRDLHCWEAQFTRTRSGDETSFTFRINVRDLPDVKYEQGPSLGTDFQSLSRVLP